MVSWAQGVTFGEAKRQGDRVVCRFHINSCITELRVFW